MKSFLQRSSSMENKIQNENKRNIYYTHILYKYDHNYIAVMDQTLDGK